MKYGMLETELQYGILNWYPFKEGASVLFTKECSYELRADLLRRGIHASDSNTESFEDAAVDEKYDYIIAYIYIETSEDPVQELVKMKSKLKPDGHLFLICENRFALKNFAGDYDRFTGKVFDGIEGYGNFTKTDQQRLGGRCYSRGEVLGFLDRAGFERRQGYSVLPGLMMPQQIYRWDTVPTENMRIRYTPIYNHPSSVFLNESAIYAGIIENDMFHQMANAYLIDCSVKGEFFGAKSITVSMDRGKYKSMSTIIKDDGTVVKKAIYAEGNASIDSLIENTRKLAEHGLNVVFLNETTLGVCDKKALKAVCMDFIDAPTAQEYLRNLIFEDRDEFIRRMDEFLALIQKSSEKCEDVVSELGECYEDSYIDLVPINCFVKDGEFLFFDQEFSVKKFPISVPMMRALDIVYMNDARMNEIVPEDYFIKAYGLDKKRNAIRLAGHKYIDELRQGRLLNGFRKEHWVDYAVINENKQRMNFSREEFEQLFLNPFENIDDKKIYLFGSGNWGKAFLSEFGNLVRVEAFLDNNSENHGSVINGVRVTSPDEILSVGAERVKVIVCVKNYVSIVRQLKAMGVNNYCLYNPGITIPEANIACVECDDSWKEEAYLELSNTSKSDDAEGKEPDNQIKIGYVAGVFDFFHVGHLNVLKRARENCDYLLVGVVSDVQATSNKTHSPYINENERLEIVKACRYVDKAFILPPDASGTRDVHRKYHFDVQFSGSDYEHDEVWLRERDWLRSRGADLIFFPYTESVSSTKIKEDMKKECR